jgi:DNA-binding transcriptional LysR family regulator
VGIAHSEHIVSQVLANRTPVGLVEAIASDEPGVDVRPFAEDQMVLVAPAGHPWLRSGVVTSADLKGTPVLRRETGSRMRMLVDRHLELAGIEVRTAMELGTTEALIAAVRAGIGVAWVPRITVAQDAAAGTLAVVEVHELEVRRTLSVVTLRGVRLSGAAQAFLDLLLATRPMPISNAGRRRKTVSGRLRN